MNVEEWRPIPGYEGRYEVSSHGRVRSLSTVLHGGKVLSGETTSSGHRRVTLFTLGAPSRRVFVHRIVCIVFNGLPTEGKNDVLHWDDNPENNFASNLRWGDASENYMDSIRNGSRRDSSLDCPNGHPWRGQRKRCNLCENAKGREVYFARIASGMPDSDERHGKYSGYRAGCRCIDCLTAKRTYSREWKRNARLNASSVD